MITNARKEKGWSTRELGEKIGITCPDVIKKIIIPVDKLFNATTIVGTRLIANTLNLISLSTRLKSLSIKN